MKRFMIDIETTGVNRETDDIIEIAIVEMVPIDEMRPKVYRAGEQYHRVLHTDKRPEGKFAIENMSELYDKANLVNERLTPEEIREEINKFLYSCGGEGAKNTQLVGFNAGIFDVQFMFDKGYLIPSGYDEENNLTGDVHYRIYDMTGVIEGLSDSYGLPRKVIQGMAKHSTPYKLPLPEGKDHDALYDCYKQINLLNGLNAVRTILK